MEKQAILMRCPFCFSQKTATSYKESKGEGGKIKRSAYVRCGTCYARGPLVSSHYLSEEKIKALAVEGWAGEFGGADHLGTVYRQ